MCGIVALMTLANNGFFSQDLDIFEQMLYVDALRGPDSTGVFLVDKRQGIQGIKHASHPMNTLSSPAWKSLRSDAIREGKILVGHNRKATHGTINNENAHPFYEKHIVLVHNGMLWDHKNKLAERDVDSHAFAAALADTDKDSVPQLIADTDGAYAFVWWDREQKKLFFTRNKDRPLNIIRYNNKIVMASEAWMAMGAIRRVEKNLSFKENDPNAVKTWEVAPDVLYSYDFEGNLERKDIPAKKVQATTTTHNTGPTVAKMDNMPHGTTKTSGASNTAVIPFQPRGNTIYKSGELVLCTVDKVQDVRDGAVSRLRFVGRTSQVGKPQWDVNGMLPVGVDYGDVQDWVGKKVMGRIMSVNPHLAAGPSLMIANVSKAGEQTESHNKTRLYEPEWSHVHVNCKCKHCSSKVMPFDRAFTNVKIDSLGNFEVICADCVENRIENAEVKEDFIQRRIAAMDSWEPSSEKPAIGTNNPIVHQSPPTLQ